VVCLCVLFVCCFPQVSLATDFFVVVAVVVAVVCWTFKKKTHTGEKTEVN